MVARNARRELTALRGSHKTSPGMRSPSILTLPAILAALSISSCDAPPAPAPPSASASSAPPASASAPPSASASAEPELRIVGASQILVAFKGAEIAPRTVTRTRDDAKKRAEEALAKIQQGALTFEAAAKTYSDDEGSKKIGGALGNFERYAMPPAFADAAFSLKVGDTSGVVETKRGFHIIKRTQ
jgi:peptidyl-prolyl cis-trans isomerase NIMA-interacting 1